ncbi:hypothetical protein SNE40_001373 [Patella caerulea]|uniref:Uncharacterized protein n=1 Tax=Patella caerulea TaxID=87958 RepID=A0AAN8Q825_PATCE
MEETTEKLAEQFVELFPRPFLEAVTEIKTNYRMKNLKWVTTQSVENFKVELSWDIYENSPIKIRKRVKLSDNNQDNKPKSIKLEPLQTVRVKIEPESPKINKLASKGSIENNSIDTGAAEQKSTPIPSKSSSAPPKRRRPGKEQMVNHCVNNGATPQKHKSSTIPSISSSAPPQNDPNPVKNPKRLSSKSSSAPPQNDPNLVKNPKGLSSISCSAPPQNDPNPVKNPKGLSSKSSSAPPQNAPNPEKNPKGLLSISSSVQPQNDPNPVKNPKGLSSISSSAPPQNDPNPVKNPKGLSSISSSAPPQNNPNPVKNPKGLSSKSSSAPPQNDPKPVKNPKGLSSKSSSAPPQNGPKPVKKTKRLSSKPEKKIKRFSVNNGWRNVVLESVIYEMYNGTVVIYGGDWHTGEAVYFSFPSLYSSEVIIISSFENFDDFWAMDAKAREPSVRSISGYNAYYMPCFITAESLCKFYNNPHVYQGRY